MIDEIRSRLSSGGWLVLLHANADADAVSTAAVIALTYPSCAVSAPAGVNREGKRLAKLLGIEIDESKPELASRKVVAVDTAGPEMLPGVELPGDAVVIDHHSHVKGWGARLYHTDTSKSSCAEVIIEIVGAGNLSKGAARAAMFGILSDTGHFRHAKPSALRAFAEMSDISGTSPEQIFNFFSDMPDDNSVRIARLKGAQRLRFFRAGDFVVGASQVGAHEADVCRALLNIGCDVVFVSRQDGAHVRVSGRARQGAVEAGIDLDGVMRNVAEPLRWTGGGHPAAAGMSGEGDAEAAANFCVHAAIEQLKNAARDGKNHK